MPSQTDAILHRLPRSSILRSHTSRSARSEHFVHPLQQETLLISEKIYFLRMCSKKYHILPQPNARNVRPNFRYFPGKNPHEWPHKRAVLCCHLLSFISLNVPLLFRIPVERTASNLRTAPPEMVETLSASQRNFTLRCSGIVQHWPFRQFCPKAPYFWVHRRFRACWYRSRFTTFEPAHFCAGCPVPQF